MALENNETLDRPVFIGGTGRSGTSVMADLVASHPAFFLPGHENKLISERCGIREVIRELTEAPDIQRGHFAIVNFYNRAMKMRKFGFVDGKLNMSVNRLMNDQRLNFQAAFEQVQRDNPNAQGSIHSIGQGFGVEYFEHCVKVFLSKLIAYTDVNGIVDTDGLLKPFFVAKNLSREELLTISREFIISLYGRAGQGRFVDDTPSNATYVAFLFELFPKMKFIQMIRHPADIVSSYLQQVWFPSDADLAVAQISKSLLHTEKQIKALPEGTVMTLRMEDLIKDKEQTCSKLGEFLGVDAKFNAAVVVSDKGHVGRAQDENPALGEKVSQAMGDWMDRYGYH